MPRRFRVTLPWSDPPPEVVEIGELIKRLSDRMGGRRLHVTVIPQLLSDDDAKRVTRLVDWLLEDRDGVRLYALECCRAAVDQGPEPR
jgi:hypothetical protein